MNRAMTQVVVKAQQVLRKEQAVLQLASKREINDILNLYYQEGWIDRSRDDLEFIFETSPNTCFKFTLNGQIIGVTFVTSAGNGIYYGHGALIASPYRNKVNYLSAGPKLEQYVARLARLELTYATKNVIPLYRDLFNYKPLCNYRGAVINPDAAVPKRGAARPADDSDFPALLGYNQMIYKADRERLIRHFLDRGAAQAFVLPSAAGGIDAYAMARKLPKDRGYALGPVLANDRDSAVEVIAAAAQALRDHPLYIEGNEEKLASFVADGICRWEGTFTLKMYKGERNLLEDEDRIYGIFSRYIS
jgi:hypothetical protein